ncbi:c-type cytochrome [Trinickia mobilis]|uniref:c-type cytochrome n=1 Tax=Trinickia mobilis TaxID=2816356 RepID=UPI001A8C4272|nr:c-type cytochrome [Trinickia mobilis]
MKRSRYCAAALATAGAFTLGGPAQAEPAPGLALAQQRNCMSCHAERRPLMGPAFHDVAAKYASRPDAVAYLTRKISEGGSGVWGRVPMPANTQLTPDDAHALATWVLTLK